jgi:hypothetical protein
MMTAPDCAGEFRVRLEDPEWDVVFSPRSSVLLSEGVDEGDGD